MKAREMPVTVQVFKEAQATREVPVVPEAEGMGEPDTEMATSPVMIPNSEMTVMHSVAADRDYRIYVTLPTDYYEQATDPLSYPVLYVLDGDFIIATATGISRLISFEGFDKLIIVGVGYPSDDVAEVTNLRAWDFLPNTANGGGGGADFLKFIQEELIPHVDARYRTNPSDRILAGWSYGGILAIYALFHATGTFRRYIVMSPTLHYDHKVAFEYEETYASSHAELPIDLFMCVGESERDADCDDYEMVTNLKEFHQVMEERNYEGLKMEVAILEEVVHCTSPSVGISRGLVFFYR